MTEWWYSQLIFIEKNHFYQQCTSYASAVRKSVGNAFSGDLETRISIFFPFAVRLRNTSWRHWIKQAVKKVNLWGGDSCREKCLEKSLEVYQLYQIHQCNDFLENLVLANTQPIFYETSRKLCLTHIRQMLQSCRKN